MSFRSLLKEIRITWRDYDRWRSCAGKVRYGHRDTAELACAAMLEKRGIVVTAYPCRYEADVWHIGKSERMGI